MKRETDHRDSWTCRHCQRTFSIVVLAYLLRVNGEPYRSKFCVNCKDKVVVRKELKPLEEPQ